MQADAHDGGANAVRSSAAPDLMDPKRMKQQGFLGTVADAIAKVCVGRK